MTETGQILGDLRKSRKKQTKKLNYIYMYAIKNNLDPKCVGIYVLPNGHIIEDRYPSKAANNEFQRIAEIYEKEGK